MERYKIVKDIGAGNFGVARLVRDKWTRELFAVKFIERGRKIDEHVQREIMNHRSLKHPNIVQFKESGCCKAPSICGFEFKNATYWKVPKKPGAKAKDSDCTTLSNKQNKLCYDCRSCKGGMLANIRHEWRSLAILHCCILALLTLVYCVGCCATKNNRFSTYNKRRGNFGALPTECRGFICSFKYEQERQLQQVEVRYQVLQALGYPPTISKS